MAYKKIILGIGVLHLALLILLLFYFQKNYSAFLIPFTEGAETTIASAKSAPFKTYFSDPTDAKDKRIPMLILLSPALLFVFPLVILGSLVRKKLKKNNKKQLEQLAENENRNLFFSIVSHDLKTPARHLIALSDLINHDLDLPKEDYQKLSGMIHTSAKKHYDLLSNLLDWSTSQMYGEALPTTACNLHHLVDEQIIYHKDKAQEKNITVKNLIPEELLIEANANLFNTVLRNLLDNAIKFTYNNGMIFFHAVKTENKIIIKVQDTGMGMNEETLKNLFNLKFLRSMRGTQKETGSGIGLILCKEIIEKMNGKITVISKKNEGSTFILQFPVQ